MGQSVREIGEGEVGGRHCNCTREVGEGETGGSMREVREGVREE